jgi:hypothetical protein
MSKNRIYIGLRPNAKGDMLRVLTLEVQIIDGWKLVFDDIILAPTGDGGFITQASMTINGFGKPEVKILQGTFEEIVEELTHMMDNYAQTMYDALGENIRQANIEMNKIDLEGETE